MEESLKNPDGVMYDTMSFVAFYKCGVIPYMTPPCLLWPNINVVSCLLLRVVKVVS